MIRIVRLSFKQEHVKDFLTLFDERKERIRSFEGCQYLELWQDNESPNVFYTFSLWQSPASLESYRISAIFQDTWSKVSIWFNEKPKAFSANSHTKIH